MKCIVCKSKLTNFFNLGNLPPSDYFAPSKILAKNSPLFKLSVGRCKKCSLVQNEHLVSANTRYKKLIYSYNSANSNYAKQHWHDYTSSISKLFKKNLKLLDIGCNDGYLLNLVQKKTKSNFIFGLDASPFQVYQSKKNIKKLNFLVVLQKILAKFLKKIISI